MVVRSRERFWVDGTLSTSIGLCTDSLPPPAMAAQRYTEWATGLDCDRSSPDNVFDNVEYTFQARMLRAPDSFDSAAVYSFFANAQTISLSTVPNFYYKIRRVVSVVPEADPIYRGNEIVYTVTLLLAPFKYLLANTEITNVSGIIQNPGTRYARPLYRLYDLTSGTNEVRLTVNGSTFKVSGIANLGITNLYVDADKMICYDQANRNLMPYSTGQLPFLNPGANSVLGTYAKVALTMNARCY